MAGWIVGLRTREQLVPAREARLATIDIERPRLMPEGEGMDAGVGDHLGGSWRGQRLDAGLVIALRQNGQDIGQRRPRAGLSPDRGLQREAQLGQFDGDIDAGFTLQTYASTESGVLVERGFDRELPSADAKWREGSLPSGVAERRHGPALPLFLIGRLPQQLDCQNFMAVHVGVGLDRDRLPDDALDGEWTAFDPWG